jgi:two-component system sensor histidine kinase BaeS
MRTLRNRLVLSHIVPFLLIIPLVGIALIYVLETQVLLPDLASDLTRGSALVNEIAGQHPAIWTDKAQAQALADKLAPYLTARLMFLDTEGHILASTDPADRTRIGQLIPSRVVQDLQTTLGGETKVRTVYSQLRQAEIADVLAPTKGPDGRVLGIVRLTNQLTGLLYDRFQQLRTIILTVLVAGLLLGAGLGLGLALNIERPLRETTLAIERLAGGRQLTPLPERGTREIRTLLHAFNTLAQRLRTAEETRRQLLANLVHELGRPLGAFYSALQALLGGADEDPQFRREMLLGMSAEVQGMQRLLDDLTGLHNQESGRLELRPRPVDLGEWLPAMLAPWREAAQKKGLSWEIAIPIPGAIPTVQADPDRLAQAIGNLLSNAIKYTAAGTVSVAAGNEGDEVWVRVSDTGRGIEKDEQARIFEPFYRAGSDLLYPEGLGLGLAITRDLIVAHGGRLDLESDPSSGSRFTIRLPVTSPQPALTPLQNVSTQSAS